MRGALESTAQVWLVVVTIVILALPLVRGQESEYSLEEDRREDHEVAALVRQRAVAFESLGDLRDEHAAGKITDEDHTELRQV